MVTTNAGSFNGATAFRPWKRRCRQQREGHPLTPSMEPQPFGHGNFQEYKGPVPFRIAFNGATAFRPWKPSSSMGISQTMCCLQWSHSLSAMETPRTFGEALLDHMDLQWSHSLSAMETPRTFGEALLDHMDLQWSHSLSAMETGLTPKRRLNV